MRIRHLGSPREQTPRHRIFHFWTLLGISKLGMTLKYLEGGLA